MKSQSRSLCALLLATTALATPWAVSAQDAPEAATPEVTTPEVTTDAASDIPETTIIVRGKNVPNTMRRTAEVTAILTADDLKRTGDDSAAVALTRVTGLSLVEGRFVYVRGLGERYSSALLNGSPLPSPEPLQRVVPLDLFPSSILSRVAVQKTYSADYWGEFGGGLIDLKTVTSPREPFLSVSIGTGGNSETTFKDGYTHYGSDSDFFGFDDGTRDMPSRLEDALAGGLRVNSNNFDDVELQKIGWDFQNAALNLIQETNSVPVNFSANVAGGTRVSLGEGELGLIGVVDFSNSWKTRNGIQETALLGGANSDEIEVDTQYSYRTTENHVGLNGLFGLGYRLGGHNVQWTNLVVRNTTKRTQVRVSENGADSTIGQDVRRDQNGWYERQLVTSQLTGTHPLSDKLNLTWRTSYAQTTRDVPYEKQIGYNLQPLGYRLDTSRVRNRTDFSNLEDEVTSFGATLSYDVDFGGGRNGQVMAGFDSMETTRTSGTRQFELEWNGSSADEIVLFTRVDYMFGDFNIRPDRFVLSEVTPGQGASGYEGDLKVDAAFVKADIEVMPLVRVAAGLRYEQAEQQVQLVNLVPEATPLTPLAPLESEYVLPSATVTWNFKEDMQLRFGASQTIGRPQFRELAPQAYLDPDQDRLFSGNPFLVDTEIMNLDARYEWYYDAGEYFTVGAFAKELDKPVESFVLDTGSGDGQQSYLNAPKATLYGLEFDYKGLFDSPVSGAFFDTKQWLVAVNYTWTDSKVKVGSGDTVTVLGPNNTPSVVAASDFLEDGVRLQGQSEHVLNMQFGWTDEEAKSSATLLLGYVSERTSARGKGLFPDLIQEPGAMLDFTYRKGLTGFGRPLNFGVEARNLLGTEYQEYQEQVGRAYVNRYELGTSLSFSLSTEW